MATSLRAKKKIIILCDGTWNEPDAPCPTNIVKLARSIAPRDSRGLVQTVFYDQGVGTEGRLDKYLGGAFGKGVAKNVLDGYRFIAHNYTLGDDIYLFGFSRGGYTARAIAGMVACIGLLPKHRLGELKDAYAYYRTEPAKRNRNLFELGQSTEIRMVGVFDTVGALGAPTHTGQRLSRNWIGFFDTTLSPKVRSAYQALAIDEQRSLFAPDIWVGEPGPNQTVEQCWFRGAHSDIGGGYPEATLSDIALNWLAKAAMLEGLELSHLPADAGAAMVKPHDAMTGFYKALGLIGKGKIDRLADLTFGEQQQPINLTVHASAVEYFTSHPEAIRLWHNPRAVATNKRLAPRVKVSRLEGRFIQLVQNEQHFNAEILDINDTLGMKVQCDHADNLQDGNVTAHVPGMKPTQLHKVWGNGQVVGLH